MTDTENEVDTTDTVPDYTDLKPHVYTHRRGYYENHSREALIAACERKDRNIARLDQMMIVQEQRWHLAESRAAKLQTQIERLWLLAERDLEERENG